MHLYAVTVSEISRGWKFFETETKLRRRMTLPHSPQPASVHCGKHSRGLQKQAAEPVFVIQILQNMTRIKARRKILNKRLSALDIFIGGAYIFRCSHMKTCYICSVVLSVECYKIKSKVHHNFFPDNLTASLCQVNKPGEL